MGGLRSVNLWAEKPRYDHRFISPVYDYYKPNEKTRSFSVWQENGWYAQTGSVRAKKFLKQDKEVLNKVWSLIYASIIPVNHPPVDGPEKLTDIEYEQLYRNEKYDGICCLSNKRFLLEINLATNSVYHIEPRLVCDGELPSDSDFFATRYFIDEDHNRPWFYKEFSSNKPNMRCEKAEWF
jgi:hypothetical protein